MRTHFRIIARAFSRTSFINLCILFCCFLLEGRSLRAQDLPPELQRELDSLNRVLKKTKQDTVKVATLNVIAAVYLDIDADTAYVISKRAEKLAKRIGYKYGEAVAYSFLGYILEYRGEIDLALKYYRAGLKLARELHSKDGEASCLGNIALIYKSQGNDVKALECNFQVLKIAEEIKHDEIYLTCLHNISTIFQSQGEKEKALVYLFKELRLARKIGDKRIYGFAMARIGSIHREEMVEYIEKNASLDTVLQARDKVLWYYSQGLKTFKELRNGREIGACYRGIGMAYKCWGDYLEKNKSGRQEVLAVQQTALDYLFKSLEADKEITHKQGNALTLQYIGELYLSMGKVSLAEQYANSSFKSSKETNTVVTLQKNVNLLYRIYDKQGKHQDALRMLERSVALTDSLSNLETQKEVLKKEFEYEKDKKEQENQRLKAANQIQQLSLQRNRFALYGIAIISLLIIGAAILLIRISRIKMSQQSIQLEQKLLRSQMNPHFIFNALTAIQGFIYKNEPRETGRFLSSFSILMRSILENSKEEYIPLEEEITWLENYVNLQRLRFTDGLEIQVIIDAELNLGGTLIPPMLIQPFVENAIEHGFKDTENLKMIRIDFSREDNFLAISVTDNGSGFEKGASQPQAKHVSRAVRITQDRLSLLNKRKRVKIEFSIESVKGEGTKVRFAVPLVIGD